ncbi:MAG: LD-carboxypeptidase [Candidatus Aminicenantes bacterium]|nr:MAG: LD-carboxypeptidase [Candidatus Aminicenantes bacterium]
MHGFHGIVESVKSIWRPLEPGEPIGVVALSGPVDPAKLEAGLTVLRDWGHPVIEAANLRAEQGYLAGSDSERLAGLEEVLGAGVRWIVAARGGFGCTRLLPSVSLDRLREREVSLIGYSDLTAFLNPLAQNGGAVQIHGPMAAAGLTRPHNANRLRALLTGELSGGVLFRFPEGAVARSGRAVGPALGGNLTLVTALLGTPWEPDFDGCVLFLEEVGEPLYRLDRMLTHLRGSGKLRNVKALIGGSLRGCGPVSDRSDGWRRMLVEAAPAEVPVVVGLPFGHGAANLAFPIGAIVDIDTDRRRITWS